MVLNATQTEVAEVTSASTKLVHRPAAWALCLALLIAIGILRIVATYHVLSHTIDEPSHLACGIEWWEKGVYRIETKHAPLSRISIAFLPYLAGVRIVGQPQNWMETFPTLAANGHYWQNLTLARVGILPFFVIATLVVFLWTKRLYGTSGGLLAAAIFTMLPTVLAHSAVATTDIALTATFCWALYAFTLWLQRPNWKTAALFGVSSGLALATKFSTIVFLPACAAPIFAMYLVAGQRNWRLLLRSLAVVVICAFFTTWSAYRFSHAPLRQVTTAPDRMVAKVFGPSSGTRSLVSVVTARVPGPAPEIIDGLRVLRNQNNEGTRSYLFGHTKEGGFWYFFIAALAVKTPLAVLLLTALGSGLLAARYWRDRSDWQSPAPLVSMIMILVATAPARINMGVRYVMPVFVFISMIAALGIVALWGRREHQTLSRVLAVLVFCWMAISSARAHPDYLAYFNEFGGSDLSRLLVVSDLDWGQDLSRLAAYLRERHIDHIRLAYEGFYEPGPLGLPETQVLKCGGTPSGWVIVAVRRVRRYPECWPWLPQQQRLAVVGKTMWVYHIPNE